uniref:Laccase n=2 Tax=Phlebia TaxID=5307 RepID=LAC1_PHLRA|nr:RecName: Full=Laccase; AltName: Full=Benzenediol:oxygen oxidoreductase; AltName: Full=Diphenol oxidase; AltName: Full=Ligninolytic phenoloxidase; AltName: Full=Urishiol oxidase; Flags: Precursor [Phlebia radiata]CAA36379.2 laccase [Phlebia radiata]
MHTFLRSTALVVAGLSARALASIGPVTDFHIVNAAVSPDGFSRQAVLAEGVFPGPLIAGNKGDNFQINVIDELTNATMLKTTTIHWHGFFQHGTNWADGPAFINQCPIASGDSFLYNFQVPDQAGTFWYHSHLSTQYCDGLRGPFVVYDPADPYLDQYDVDDDSTVITLADWYHTAARLGSPFPAADTTLINGLGRCGEAGCPVSDLAVISVTKGKRYRFRLVSISCDSFFTFSIDGHSLNVIEVDATNHQPLTVDELTIYAGQRYSFILTADQDVDNYWIRANPGIGITTGFAGGINSAILRYDGADVVEPTTTQATSPVVLSESNLAPLTNAAAPGLPEVGGVDLALNFNLTFDGPSLKFQINGVTFVPPTVPVLLQILSGAQSAADLLPSGSVYALPSNATIELSLPAGALGGPHPFHLHGHTFSVVRPAGSTTYNYVNPVQRDVVSIGNTGDNVTIRFDTNNPGPWFLHCHIDWHLEAGFAVVFAEDIPDVASINPVPQDWSNLCPIYNALDASDH